jgi:hypothetical protein
MDVCHAFIILQRVRNTTVRHRLRRQERCGTDAAATAKAWTALEGLGEGGYTLAACCTQKDPLGDCTLTQAVERPQIALFAECLEDWIGEDNPVRMIVSVCPSLILAADAETTGRS